MSKPDLTPEGPGHSAPRLEYVERVIKDFAGSPAEAYERSRGIDGVKLGLGYDPVYPWPREEGQRCGPRFPAVVFIFYSLEGIPVARQGRYIGTPSNDLPKTVSHGKTGQGVFNLPALASPWVIVCEGPNTAAALIQRGYSAFAIGGKFAQPWLLQLLATKEGVFIAFDADAAGEKAATDFANQLLELAAPSPYRLAPPSGDWNDYLMKNPGFVIEALEELGQNKRQYQPTSG